MNIANSIIHYEHRTRHCEERSDEAIQEITETNKFLDCFASARNDELGKSQEMRNNPGLRSWIASLQSPLSLYCSPQK